MANRLILVQDRLCFYFTGFWVNPRILKRKAKVYPFSDSTLYCCNDFVHSSLLGPIFLLSMNVVQLATMDMGYTKHSPIPHLLNGALLLIALDIGLKKRNSSRRRPR